MPPEFRLVRYTGKNDDYYQIEERYWSWWPFSMGWKYRKITKSIYSGFASKYGFREAAENDFDLLIQKVSKERSDVLLTIVKVSDENVKPNNYTLADCKPLQIGWTKCKFSFEAMDAQGREIKNEIWADDEDAAETAIRQAGLFVTKIKRLDDPDEYVVR